MKKRTTARRISKSSRRSTTNMRATHKNSKNLETPTPPSTATTTVVEANADTANAVNANQEETSPTPDEATNKSKSDYYNEFIAKYMQLKCELCGEFLENFFLLKTHFRDKHQCNGYAMCCDKQFKKRIFLVDHINYHLNPKCFQCKICSKCFKSRSSLDEHLKKVHPKSEHLKYECKTCEKKFARKNDYEKHNLKHQTEKNFICEICNKSFANKLRLSAHLKNMHGDAVNFICNYCGQEYKNKTNFERHVAEHEGIVVAPVQCSICGEWLKSKETLHTHMGTHNRIDAECETCGRICPTKRALTAHIKYMHSTESNLVCTFCNKTFKRKGNLQEHMAMHTGEKHHTCMHCSREFRSRANMYTHIKKDHIDEWMKSKLEKSTKLAEISKNCNSSGVTT